MSAQKRDNKDSVKAAKDTSGKAAKTRKPLKPGYVAAMSAIVPGAGQVYNRQWYKAPVIYAGLGAVAYAINYYEKSFVKYKVAYKQRTDGDSNTIDQFDPSLGGSEVIYDPDQILRYREEDRRFRDLSYLVLVAVYAANVLDAYVYAHLRDFDVSPNLSLQVEPLKITNIAGRPQFSHGIVLKLK